nr:brain-enriched guanylate kinase-associated protein isoform X8 [Manis javanica]
MSGEPLVDEGTLGLLDLDPNLVRAAPRKARLLPPALAQRRSGLLGAGGALVKGTGLLPEARNSQPESNRQEKACHGDPGMRRMCLLSACCMLGSRVLRAVMGTWERWAWGTSGSLGEGWAGERQLFVSRRRVYRGVRARGLRQLSECWRLCLAANPGPLGILSPEIPSPTQPLRSPPGLKGTERLVRLPRPQPQLAGKETGRRSPGGLPERPGSWRPRPPGQASQRRGCALTRRGGGGGGVGPGPERSALPADAAPAPGARGRNGQSSVFPGVSRGPWVRPPGPLKARHGSESLGEAPGAASPGRRRSRPAPLAPRRKCDPAPAACGPGRPPAPVGLTAAGGSSRPVHGGLPRCAGLGRKGLRATRGRVCASRAGSPAREQGLCRRHGETQDCAEVMGLSSAWPPGPAVCRALHQALGPCGGGADTNLSSKRTPLHCKGCAAPGCPPASGSPASCRADWPGPRPRSGTGNIPVVSPAPRCLCICPQTSVQCLRQLPRDRWCGRGAECRAASASLPLLCAIPAPAKGSGKVLAEGRRGLLTAPLCAETTRRPSP